jgi:hypothetical protein
MEPDMTQTTSFEFADEKIKTLVKRLRDKDVCPCCTARALAFHAAYLAVPGMGSAEAIEMFAEIIRRLRKVDVPAPDVSPSGAAH